MPNLRVYIDSDELLDSLSDEELVKEAATRNLANILPTSEVADSLRRASDELRRIHRYDLSARLDDIRNQTLAV